MPSCFFFKVDKGTTWDELIQLNEHLERAFEALELPYKRKLEYLESACFTISYDDFLEICKDISVPQEFYHDEATYSITTQDGIRKCIVICNNTDSRKIILYTAGRYFPLYAGVSA